MSQPLLRAEEVAEWLGVRVDWVYAQSRAGRIPTVGLGRYRRYRRESIEDWIRSRERATVADHASPPAGRAGRRH